MAPPPAPKHGMRVHLTASAAVIDIAAARDRRRAPRCVACAGPVATGVAVCSACAAWHRRIVAIMARVAARRAAR